MGRKGEGTRDGGGGAGRDERERRGGRKKGKKKIDRKVIKGRKGRKEIQKGKVPYTNKTNSMS